MPIVIPIGAEDTFQGVIDTVKMKAIIWDEASQGTKFDYKDIPAELEGTAAEWREKLVEAAAESSEELMNKYLETGSLDEAEINWPSVNAPSLAKSSRCCAAPPSRTRACSACWTRSSTTCLRPWTFPGRRPGRRWQRHQPQG